MRLRVLVVDDDPSVREVLTTLLDFEGVDVTTTDHGAAGIAMAERLDPDVVLLDVNLPDVDGYHVCRELKRTRRAARVFLLTARSSQEDEAHGREAGADAFIRKPFSPLQLIDLVRGKLNGKGSLLA